MAGFDSFGIPTDFFSVSFTTPPSSPSLSGQRPMAPHAGSGPAALRGDEQQELLVAGPSSVGDQVLAWTPRPRAWTNPANIDPSLRDNTAAAAMGFPATNVPDETGFLGAWAAHQMDQAWMAPQPAPVRSTPPRGRQPAKVTKAKKVKTATTAKGEEPKRPYNKEVRNMSPAERKAWRLYQKSLSQQYRRWQHAESGRAAKEGRAVQELSFREWKEWKMVGEYGQVQQAQVEMDGTPQEPVGGVEQVQEAQMWWDGTPQEPVNGGEQVQEAPSVEDQLFADQIEAEMAEAERGRVQKAQAEAALAAERLAVQEAQMEAEMMAALTTDWPIVQEAQAERGMTTAEQLWLHRAQAETAWAAEDMTVQEAQAEAAARAQQASHEVVEDLFALYE